MADKLPAKSMDPDKDSVKNLGSGYYSFRFNGVEYTGYGQEGGTPQVNPKTRNIEFPVIVSIRDIPKYSEVYEALHFTVDYHT